jgi:hypothetical protein
MPDKKAKTWVVVQYDNRPLDADTEFLRQKNMEYCERHGYKYIFITRHYNLPPYWIKVKIVRDLLNKTDCIGVLWLDTDAVVHRPEISLNSLLQKGKSFYYAPDRPAWKTIFNAGVWFILNNRAGHTIMDYWMGAYEPEYWNEKGGKWKTVGPWAGYTYEQGAFIKLIKPLVNEHLYQFPWKVLQSEKPFDESFVLHFAAEHKKAIPDYVASQ